MNATFNIAVTVSNGIGGTEKAAVLFASELARRGHRLFFITPPGPRDASIRKAGMKQVTPPPDAKGLAELFSREKIDVVHQHVPGYPMGNPNYEALALLGKDRPRLIETNVFGRLEDPEGDKWVDFRGFISRTSAVQAFQRSHRRLTLEALRDKTVTVYPLPALDPATRARARRAEIREEFGVQPHEIFILRLGRPSNKWTRNELRVVRAARRTNPALRLLLMEPNREIWREVEAGVWGEGILLQPAMSDFERLAAVYSAGDLMLHMANWGESYGYTIAEAMQAGMPLIVSTTPWGDNAQVELVDHGRTGFVCNSCEGATDALLKLAADAELRAKFSAAGVERIESLSNLVTETDIIEEIINHLIRGEPLVKVAERNRELLEFQAPLARRERKVWEAENPKLRLAYLEGACYSAYRTFRANAGQLVRRLKNPGR